MNELTTLVTRTLNCYKSNRFVIQDTDALGCVFLDEHEEEEGVLFIIHDQIETIPLPVTFYFG